MAADSDVVDSELDLVKGPCHKHQTWEMMSSTKVPRYIWRWFFFGEIFTFHQTEPQCMVHGEISCFSKMFLQGQQQIQLLMACLRSNSWAFEDGAISVPPIHWDTSVVSLPFMFILLEGAIFHEMWLGWYLATLAMPHQIADQSRGDVFFSGGQFTDMMQKYAKNNICFSCMSASLLATSSFSCRLPHFSGWSRKSGTSGTSLFSLAILICQYSELAGGASGHGSSRGWRH